MCSETFSWRNAYLGYKDGFLVLPEMAFWKKEGLQKFSQAWKSRNRLKYRYLKTNVFQRNKEQGDKKQ